MARLGACVLLLFLVCSLALAADGRIVFTRQAATDAAPALWSMAADGADARPLALPEGITAAWQPCWSADGSRLAFVAASHQERSTYAEDLFLLNADGAGLWRVTGGEYRGTATARTGRLIGTIAGGAQTGLTPAQVTLTARGVADAAHPRAGADSYPFEIANVPAGWAWVHVQGVGACGNVAYAYVRAGETTDLGTVPLNGARYAAAAPSPSLDAARVVALVRQTGATPETTGEVLCLFRASDGEVLGTFRPAPGQEVRDPALSPDGRQIALVVGPPQAGALAVIAVDELLAGTAAPRVLVAGGVRDGVQLGVSSPVWSPDGARLAFARTMASATGLAADLTLINADGTGACRLTAAGPDQLFTHPTFSPDGARLAFALLRGGQAPLTAERLARRDYTADIYTCGLTGAGLTQLTTDGCSTDPTWGR